MERKNPISQADAKLVESGVITTEYNGKNLTEVTGIIEAGLGVHGQDQAKSSITIKNLTYPENKLLKNSDGK